MCCDHVTHGRETYRTFEFVIVRRERSAMVAINNAIDCRGDCNPGPAGVPLPSKTMSIESSVTFRGVVFRLIGPRPEKLVARCRSACLKLLFVLSLAPFPRGI